MCKETGGIVVNEIVWLDKKHTHTAGDETERKLRLGPGKERSKGARADCKTRSEPETKCPTVMRPASKSRYHWRAVQTKLWNNVDSRRARFSFTSKDPCSSKKSTVEVKVSCVSFSMQNVENLLHVLSNLVSKLVNYGGVASPELSFCDWVHRLSGCSAMAYYRTQRQTWIWKTSPTETLNRRHPNRTFAAEKSLPVAYKLIELCSLSLSLRRNVITTWCVKHWENSPPTRVQAASFWQNVRFSNEAGMERQM